MFLGAYTPVAERSAGPPLPGSLWCPPQDAEPECKCGRKQGTVLSVHRPGPRDAVLERQPTQLSNASLGSRARRAMIPAQREYKSHNARECYESSNTAVHSTSSSGLPRHTFLVATVLSALTCYECSGLTVLWQYYINTPEQSGGNYVPLTFHHSGAGIGMLKGGQSGGGLSWLLVFPK